MRKVKYGVGAAVVFGLAWVISNLFNFGGPGGGGPTVGVTPSGQIEPADDDDRSDAPPKPADDGRLPVVTPKTPDTAPATAAGPDEQLGAGPVAEVLIEDRDYFLHRGAGPTAEWVIADRAAIVAAADQAPGDGAGVKVRVFRAASARTTAEVELTQDLHAAGLTDSQIDWSSGLTSRDGAER